MEESGATSFYQEWASQTKVSRYIQLKLIALTLFKIQKAADVAAEESPLKQTGSAVVFAPKAENYRIQFNMNKAESRARKL